MSEWVDFPTPYPSGTVEFNFDGDPEQYQLVLQQGDLVTLLSKTNDGTWFKGYVQTTATALPTTKETGIFPASFVRKQELQEDRKESMITQDEALLNEVRTTVKVWEREMRNTSQSSHMDSSTYHQLKNRIGTIIDFAGILHDSKSSLDERTKHARKRITQLLELERRSRAGFLVPRLAEGVLAELGNTCFVELYNLHHGMQTDLEGSANVAERLTAEEVMVLNGASDATCLLSNSSTKGVKAAKAAKLAHHTSWVGKSKWATGTQGTPRHLGTQPKKTFEEPSEDQDGKAGQGSASSAAGAASGSGSSSSSTSGTSRTPKSLRNAHLRHLLLSYEVAMLTVGEPLELYFSLYCTGPSSSTKFGIPSPVETYSMGGNSAAAAATGTAVGGSGAHAHVAEVAQGGEPKSNVGDGQPIVNEHGLAKNGFFMSQEYKISVTEKGLPMSTAATKEPDGVTESTVGTLFQNIEPSELLGGLYLICQVYRVGQLELSTKKVSKKDKLLNHHRRPFGVAVFNVTEHYEHLEKINWSPPALNIYTMKNRDALEMNFHRLHCFIIDQQLSELELAPRSRGVVVGLRMLTGDRHLTERSGKQDDDGAAGGVSSRFAASLVDKGHNTPRAHFRSLVDPTTSRNGASSYWSYWVVLGRPLCHGWWSTTVY